MPSASLQVLEAWKEANYSLQTQPRAYLQPTLLLQGGCEVAASLGDLDTSYGGKGRSAPALALPWLTGHGGAT